MVGVENMAGNQDQCRIESSVHDNWDSSRMGCYACDWIWKYGTCKREQGTSRLA